MTHKLPDVFSKNRSEETREDIWADFVVPPFLNELGIKTQSKAIVIVGGRGCGKTTLLRYFCHATQFSAKRQNITQADLLHVGLYWRADTNFLNSFAGGGQTPETWRAAFDHVLACELGKEIIQAVRNLNCNPERQHEYGKLDELDLEAVQDFDETLGRTLHDLDRTLQKSRRKMSAWLNNLETLPHPTFLSAKEFLKTLVAALQEQLPYLSNSTFAVFIDEYENLRIEQQKFINGLLKHGAPPLLFNIAMKRNGWHTTQTMGPESIQLISDYREIDLEEEVARDFDLFAAELLFFRLAEHEPDLLDRLPIVPDQLRSIDHISHRYKNENYRARVIEGAERLLPRVIDRAAAKEILADPRLREKLSAKIGEALLRRKSLIPPSSFIDDKYPEASTLMPALLNRPREDPDSLLAEFEALKTGKESRLLPTESLVSNNLFGCVNAIYLEARRPSILFSGFTSLTLIARENIRHLLELIHRIFKVFEASANGDLPVVPPAVQAKAVKEASELILGTVSGHGVHGAQLYNLAQCLGSIFLERHKNDRQSEPETNHFTLAGGDLNEKLRMYLREAEKWSVLYLGRETKMKSAGAIDNDYILNPIFSPHFQISFRKKRSLPISAVQLLGMLEGDQRSRDGLVREFCRQNSGGDDHPDLFSETGA
ncbi:MAG: hypothetical protein NFW16_19060 [Candidatus Accumulibacter sp.]|uniref:ORC-CDC6 family AAA ATPase n=1 Tax=Accumulibacter sp. TaxID=2053492 RepID=UPI002587CCFE|nr:hypothetical protein [Accumulibacter sp.]MCM8623773.1 hypothetical protein [Accumulibacter sp.]